MRRLKFEGPGVYHCMSRVVAGERLLDSHAKEVLRKMLWEVATFCGVEVLAYCVMDNHFHVLLRVFPPRPGEITEGELLRRYEALYAERRGAADFPPPRVLKKTFELGGEDAARWRRRLEVRMGNVSAFMQALKQRFAVWYNRNHRRFGAFWAERFKSVLVENTAFALKTVSAYIDLNPVRVGLVEDPGEYRWCSYADAMGGKREALAGIRASIDVAESARTSEVLGVYRQCLFGKGGTARKEGEGTIPEARVKAVLAAHGEVPICEIARHRMRALTHGRILGSEAFVRDFGQAFGLVKKNESDGEHANRTPHSEKGGAHARSLFRVGCFGKGEALVAWQGGRRSSTVSGEP